MRCRHCNNAVELKFIDLGFAPPSNAYLSSAELNQPETYYPLKTSVCNTCWLVQTEDYTKADKLFNSEYAYFSSTSKSWLAHAKKYTNEIVSRFGFNEKSLIIEIASNDGYLLKNFVEIGIPCLGIEPTNSTAKIAESLGINVLREFFGEKLGMHLAKTKKQADLIVGNNVYAHVPDINDFTKGLRLALKKNGVITLEFPHLMRLIENNQFDTIYHEHFSYLSLYTVSRIFEKAKLRIWDVEELQTHGGSLRVFGCHYDDPRSTSSAVHALLKKEEVYGLKSISTYVNFQTKVDNVKNDLLKFLIKQKELGKKIAAYGAAAKGNTFLNYAGVKPDLLAFVSDAAIAKQGKFMPGSHIPILPPNEIEKEKPDYVIILPWNIANEIIEQNCIIRKWGGNFVTFIPEMKIL